MKNLSLSYTSLSVISFFIFSPSQAMDDKLNVKDNPQALIKQVIEKSEEELYKEALDYRDGKIVGFPKNAPNTLNKAESLFLFLANKGHLKAMHNTAMIQYKMGNYTSSFNWFLKASEGGLIASYKNLLKMKNEIEENKLNFKSLEEEQEIKSLFQKVTILQHFPNADYTTTKTWVDTLNYNQGKIDEAEQLITSTSLERDVEVLNYLAILNKQRGNIEETERLLLIAAKLGDLRALTRLGILYQEKGDKETAKHILIQAKNQGFIPALTRLAVIMIEEEKFVEAETLLSHAIKQKDNEAKKVFCTLMNNLGAAACRKDNLNEARIYFKKAADLKDPLNIYNLGTVLHDEGDVEGAIEKFIQAAKQGFHKAKVVLEMLKKQEQREKKV